MPFGKAPSRSPQSFCEYKNNLLSVLNLKSLRWGENALNILRKSDESASGTHAVWRATGRRNLYISRQLARAKISGADASWRTNRSFCARGGKFHTGYKHCLSCRKREEMRFVIFREAHGFYRKPPLPHQSPPPSAHSGRPEIAPAALCSSGRTSKCVQRAWRAAKFFFFLILPIWGFLRVFDLIMPRLLYHSGYGIFKQIA